MCSGRRARTADGGELFIPLHDKVALKYIRRASATVALIVMTTAIHAAITSGLFGASERIDLGLGLIPSVLFGKAVIGPDISHVPAWVTPLTSIFIHGSFWHLAGNLLFLWVLGDNVEDAMGSFAFAAFYLLSGIGAGLTFAIINPASQSPLIGASGAVSGVAAAYLLLYPRARIVGLLFNLVPVSLSAGMVIGVWIGYQILSALLTIDPHVGWWAHVGGIVSGILLLASFKRREVP